MNVININQDRFLLDSSAVEQDLCMVPLWRVELLRDYGCESLWPILPMTQSRVRPSIVTNSKISSIAKTDTTNT